MKIYCASDLHLGYPDSNYPKIKTFLNLVQQNADQLILCGDIYDLWLCEYREIASQEPMKSCHELLLQTAEMVDTIFISPMDGNLT